MYTAAAAATMTTTMTTESESESRRERERAKASERPAEWGRVCNCNELLKLAARTGLLAQVAIRG